MPPTTRRAAAAARLHQQPPAAPSTAPPPAWRKVLYEQPAGLADNYTDATFLQHLVVNAKVPQRHYWSVVQDAVAVVQQINVVAAVVVAAVQLHEGTLPPPLLLLLNGLVLTTLAAAYIATGQRLPGGSLARAVRQVVLLTTGVYLLSPTYGTLSRTISTDTIIALATLLFMLHLLFYDYNYPAAYVVVAGTRHTTSPPSHMSPSHPPSPSQHHNHNTSNNVERPVSLGAAIFASVLLASRLQSDMRVFAHLTYSLTLFLLSPYLLRTIRRLSFNLHVAVTILLFSLVIIMVQRVSWVGMVVHGVLCAFVCFAAPAWLIRIHKYKAKINGPWDEAVPRMRVG